MLVKGPFTIKWGDNTITDVEEIDVNHEVNSGDFDTIGGKVIEVDGAFKADATITLLASDIPAMAAILPQNFVANGEVMSTGETVDNADGAMDITANNCTESLIHNNLDVTACDNPGQVFRLVNARTKIDGVEIDGIIQKVMVKFVGEPAEGEATIQFFKEGTISVVS